MLGIVNGVLEQACERQAAAQRAARELVGGAPTRHGAGDRVRRDRPAKRDCLRDFAFAIHSIEAAAAAAPHASIAPGVSPGTDTSQKLSPPIEFMWG